MRCKVFEISFGWSGTKSLAKAIRLLDNSLVIRHSLTFVGTRHSEWKKDAIRKVVVGSCQFDVYNHCDVAIQFPFVHWKKLAIKYPDSRFIFPIRDTEEWIAKAQKRFRKRKVNKILKRPMSFGRICELICFGVFIARDETLRERFELHKREVLSFFEGTNRLLVLDILRESDEDTWRKLSGFFGKETPKTPFPCVRHNRWWI